VDPVLAGGGDYSQIQVNPGLQAVTDTDGHGTQMIGLIGGLLAGVDKFARVFAMKITFQQGRGKASAVRAVKAIIEMQIAAGAPLAIINFSLGYALGGALLPNQQTSTDFLEDVMLQAQAQNCIVVQASGNNPANLMENFTPDINLAKPSNPAIIVGSVSRDGTRSSFTTFQSNTGLAVDLMALGEQMWCPTNGTGSHWTLAVGTSHAAAITSGLISLLIKRGDITSVADARPNLLSIATSRKGTNWPLEPGYSAPLPRAATNWELACEPGFPTASSPRLGLDLQALPAGLVNQNTNGFSSLADYQAARSPQAPPVSSRLLPPSPYAVSSVRETVDMDLKALVNPFLRTRCID
jgi:subtilisin family serine protease